MYYYYNMYIYIYIYIYILCVYMYIYLVIIVIIILAGTIVAQRSNANPQYFASSLLLDIVVKQVTQNCVISTFR